MSTQTVTLKGRPYTFVPDADATLDGFDSRSIGSLRNSRGEHAGYVFEMFNSGNRIIMGGPSGIPLRAEIEALATLDV